MASFNMLYSTLHDETAYDTEHDTKEDTTEKNADDEVAGSALERLFP